MPLRATTTALTLSALITLPGCGDSSGSASDGAGEPERWVLSEEPSVRIGTVSGEDAYQLHDVRDAERLRDGRIAIAHQGTREVRVYGADGRFLFASGGDGDGPGEWRLVAAVHDLPGDSLLVVDTRLERFGAIDDETGAYLGEVEETLAATALPKRRHHAGLVLEAPPDLEDWDVFVPVLGALDIRDESAPVRVVLDAAGRAWVSGAPTANPGQLRIFDLAGRHRATLPLPDRFEPLAVGEAEVIGIRRDTLDVEFVEAHALEGVSAWGGPSLTEADTARASSAALIVGSESARPDLTPAFRSLAIAQEMHYARQGSYTTDVSALADVSTLELPDAVRVDLLAAGPSGWWGRLVDLETGAGCSLVYGAFLPVERLTPGMPACWDGGTEEPAGAASGG